MKWLDWRGCYKESAKGLIVPEAFSHPAKMSVGLCRKIFAFMEEKGMLKKGETVCDPFAGIFTTGLIGAMNGYQVIGIELEEKFVKLAEQNIKKNRKIFEALEVPFPVVIQSDSRKLSEIIAQAEGIVTSPPWAAQMHEGGNTPTSRGIGVDGKYHRPIYEKHPDRHNPTRRYGETLGQIGSLKDKGIEAVITAPPYAEIRQDGGSTRPGYTGMTPYSGESRNAWRTTRNQENLGNVPEGNIDSVITSPPWEKTEGAQSTKKFKDPLEFARKRSELSKKNPKARHYASPEAIAAQMEKDNQSDYGQSKGQIGQESKETYWAAMKLVYGECWKILKPQGVMAIVVKDFVRDKKRVPLCDNTVKLLEHLGFKVEYRARAWLVEDQGTRDAFTGAMSEKQRKSFFRRLSEQKIRQENHWKTLSKKRQDRILKSAKEVLDAWWDGLSDLEKGWELRTHAGEEAGTFREFNDFKSWWKNLGEPGQGKWLAKAIADDDPTGPDKVLRSAMRRALENFKGDPRIFDDERRIDWEEVVFARK